MNARAPETKLRLDELLVRRALFATRSRARDAILRGTVRVEGAVVSKPGLAISKDSAVETEDAARAYVSRAALKLAAGLDHFSLSPDGVEHA